MIHLYRTIYYPLKKKARRKGRGGGHFIGACTSASDWGQDLTYQNFMLDPLTTLITRP